MAQTTISCGELLDISVVGQFHSQLKEAMAETNGIEISAAGLQRIDGAGIQLLVAFFKEADQLHIDVSWKDISDSLVNAASLLGVSEQLHLVN